MDTISQAFDRLCGGADFYIVLGDFLDDFYRQEGAAARRAMIAEAPSAPALHVHVAYGIQISEPLRG